MEISPLVWSGVRRFFDERSIVRGERYYGAGRVELLDSSDWHVVAEAHGTDRYHVGIEARVDDPDRRTSPLLLAAWCTCPHAADGFACKHLWATLLTAADEEALVAAEHQSRTRPVEMHLIEPPPDAGMVGDLPAGPRPTSKAADRMAGQFLTQLEAWSRLPASFGAPMEFKFTGGELLFGIDVNASHSQLVIRLLTRSRKVDGGWGKVKSAPLTVDDALLAPTDDRALIAPLLGSSRHTGYDYGAYGTDAAKAAYAISPVLAHEWLPRVSEARRLVLVPRAGQTADDLVFITWDPAVALQRVRVTDDGQAFRMGTELDHVSVTGATLLAGQRYLLSGQTLRPLQSDIHPVVAQVLANNPPPIPHSMGDLLAARLSALGVNPEQMPDALRLPVVRVTPAPTLHIGVTHRPGTLIPVTLTFDYDGTRVPVGHEPYIADLPRRRLIARDTEVEQRARAWLDAAGTQVEFQWDSRSSGHAIAPRHLLSLITSALGQGWIVEGDRARYRRPGTVTMSVSSGIDWFDLTADITFDDQSASLADVLDAVRQRTGLVRLGDGSLGLLPEDFVRKYATLAGVGEEQHDGRVRFTRPQAMLLDALLSARADEAVVTVDAAFERLRAHVQRFDRVSAASAPKGFKGTLRGYQQEGLGWLKFLREFGFGGCLADDMGLGKTVMVLALLEWRRQQRAKAEDGPRPSLVVAPRSVIRNWAAEAARFTPNLVVLDGSTGDRTRDAAALIEADLVLATYGTMRRDILFLQDTTFEYVVLDEAQAIKNAHTASAKTARLLRARHRLALSGTPVENHLGELWSLFEFLNPGLLGRSSTFKEVLSSSSRVASPEQAELLSKGLRPFLLRRTKRQVAPELPARTEQTLTCELSKPERAFYDALRRRYQKELLGRIDRVGVGKSQAQILEALLRLRQAACHPGLIDTARTDVSSTKLQVLMDHMREVIDEGHKALVFSQFTSLLALLSPQLERAGLAYASLDGQTRDRDARVARFQTDPTCQVFLISLKAGGVGLNLTAADYVYLLDPWWNPAAEAQAIDRAHRIGQSREVFAYRLIAENTIEEKVLQLQAHKRALAEAVLSDTPTGLRGITREDIESLLA